MLLNGVSAMNTTPRLLSKKQVRELVLYSFAHIDRLEKAGLFPPRVRLSRYRTGRVGWLETDIRAWIEAKAAHRHGS